MSELAPYLVLGLVSGSLYGLAGIGLVLTYRTSGVFNFGHGAIAAAAAYSFYSMHVNHGWPWPIAGLVTVVLFGVIGGLVLDRLTTRFAGLPQIISVALTVGVFLAITGFLFVEYGATQRLFPQFLPQKSYEISGVLVTQAQLISAGIAIAAAVGLYTFMRTSRFGISMRAVVDNPTLISLSGDRPARIRYVSWMIGSSFAAVSGILLAPTLGLDAALLTFLVVQAFGACAIGGFSSLPLTFVGGLVVGVASSVSTKYFSSAPWSGLPSSMPFVILILALLLIPARKLPQQKLAFQQLAAAPRSYSRRTNMIVLGVIAAVLIALPQLVGSYLPVWINALTYAVLFSSLALLVWLSGQISLCQLSFAALGATTMAHLVGRDVPWLLALLLAGLASVPVGALIAIPAIRLSGIYLALVTLGFGILMQSVVFQTDLMFGNNPTKSAPRPQWGFLDGTRDKELYYLFLVLAAAAFAVAYLVSRGRLGRVLRAMAQAPTMLNTHGLSTPVTRLIVFCLSAFIASIAGAMMITQYGSVSSATFPPIQSLLLLTVLVLCGTSTLISPILAALLLAVLPGYVNGLTQDKQSLLFGLLAIGAALVLAWRPQLLAWFGSAARETEHRTARSPVRDRGRPPGPPPSTPTEDRELTGSRA